MSNRINARLQHKIDIQKNWEKAINFIPLKGEYILYDKDDNHDYMRIKIGDGVTKVNDLSFIAETWDNLINKPFYDERVLIEFPQNISNAVVINSQSLSVLDGLIFSFTKVSDNYFNSPEEMYGAKVKLIDADKNMYNIFLKKQQVNNFENGFAFIDTEIGWYPLLINITSSGNFTLASSQFFGEDLEFIAAETGIYFLYIDGMATTLSYEKGDYQQIDRKFIPSDIGTWSDMPDKPFGEIGFNFEWDGRPTEIFETTGESGIYFYKVAEPLETIIGGKIKVFDGTETLQEICTSDIVQTTEDGEECGFIANVKNAYSTFDFDKTLGRSVTFKKPGLYFVYIELEEEQPGRTISFTSVDYGIKQIDKKFIPDDIVASVSLTFDEIPTEGSQNPVKSMGIYNAISALEGKITSTFCYKGSVNNYSDLPVEGNVIGDVWNIVNADEANGVEAGDNAAWNGTNWDVLAGIVDLSNYYTKTEVDSIALNGIANLTNYYTKAEIDTKIGDCDTVISSINTLIGGENV